MSDTKDKKAKEHTRDTPAATAGSSTTSNVQTVTAATNNKATETKRERFIRLIEHRMPRALKIIGHVANLGNRNQYEYTEAEAAQVVADLTTAVNALRQKFMGQTVTTSSWRLK